MHVAIRALGTLMGVRNELELGCPITYVPPSLVASSPSNNVRQKARWVQPNSTLNGTYKYFKIVHVNGIAWRVATIATTRFVNARLVNRTLTRDARTVPLEPSCHKNDPESLAPLETLIYRTLKKMSNGMIALTQMVLLFQDVSMIVITTKNVKINVWRCSKLGKWIAPAK